MAKRIKKPKPPKPPLKDHFCLICEAMTHTEMVKEYRFHPTRKWRFDYAIPSHLIALEVEGGVWTGGRHIRASGFLGDMEKYNNAALLGWRVFRTTPKDLFTSATINLIKEAINYELQQGTTKD